MTERQPLSESHPHLKDFLPFLDDLNKETARGAVLVAAAYLERQLGAIVASLLVEGRPAKNLLEGFNAPLGTFAARSAAAEALGLISTDEFRDLQRIRKVRNEFAHNHRASFSDPGVVRLCGALAHSAKDYGDVVVRAREQFTTAAVSLILNFTNRPHYVSKKRLTRQSWPY